MAVPCPSFLTPCPVGGLGQSSTPLGSLSWGVTFWFYHQEH